ncbi:hypothetical protein [Nocardia donostiensis]|uniref:Uncharacterized protein n=1 Tax=Nocardia donostiensis TaxID=1538463 RepID=A0A1W0B769_9NOCA|nr:hypothetical protein [Nocardia donostiensis]ONM49554.1 hypothetical protein B0T46_06810 [Nocardia donostiensis]OQS18339.1 hypothetical protein B0T44_20240 [Nocardia donostiensis]
MRSYSELRSAVEDASVYTTTMETLKGIQAAGRLGIHVRSAISRALASHGIGHLPPDLPPNQDDEVRLYLLGTPIADVVSAVLSPSERGDATLRSVASSDAQEKLVQIRDIVCGSSADGI